MAKKFKRNVVSRRSLGGGPAVREAVERERASMQHWLLEKWVVDLCSASGVVPLTNPHIDLMVRSGHTSVLFEMKLCSPLDKADPLRRALLQLLEYKYLYRDHLGSDVRLCIVIERRPRGTQTWLIGHLEHLGVGIMWGNDDAEGLRCNDFTKALLGDLLPPVKAWKTAPASDSDSTAVYVSPAVRRPQGR
jgi:hypothetical protein